MSKENPDPPGDEDPKLTERVAILENDVKWMKDILSKIDKRTWWILGSVVALGIIAILVALYG